MPESAETSDKADTEDEADVEVPCELSELPFHHLNHLFSFAAHPLPLSQTPYVYKVQVSPFFQHNMLTVAVLYSLLVSSGYAHRPLGVLEDWGPR